MSNGVRGSERPEAAEGGTPDATSSESFAFTLTRSQRLSLPLVRGSFLLYLFGLPVVAAIRQSDAAPFDSFGSAFWPGYLLLTATLGVRAWRWRGIARTPRLVLDATGIHGPLSRMAPKIMNVGWEQLSYVRRRGQGDWDSLMIGVRDAAEFGFLAANFEDASSLDRIDARVRESIAALPDGEARLRRSEQHAAMVDRMLRRVPWLTCVFATGIGGAFAYQFWTGAGTNGFSLSVLGAASLPLVEAGEWHRLFSMAWLHGGWIHLSVNLSAFLLLGFLAENCLGRERFAIVLVGSIAGGSLLSVAVGSHPSVGASGGIFGLLGAFLWVLHAFPDSLSKGRRRRGIVIASVAACELALALSVPNLDWAAHLGGAAVGTATTAVLLRHVDPTDASLPTGRAEGVLAWLLSGLFCIAIARAVQLDLEADSARIDAIAAALYPEVAPSGEPLPRH